MNNIVSEILKAFFKALIAICIGTSVGVFIGFLIYDGVSFKELILILVAVSFSVVMLMIAFYRKHKLNKMQ
jgi:hypothetical protein